MSDEKDTGAPKGLDFILPGMKVTGTVVITKKEDKEK